MVSGGLTKAQRDLRRLGIGSSEIGVLAGLSPYGSVLEIWASKVHGLEKDPTDAMEFGTAVEDSVARIYARRTGKHLRKPGTLQRADKPFCMATPDRAVLAKRGKAGPIDWSQVERLAEFKATSMRLRRRWGEPGTDAVPEEHLAQTTWQMDVVPGSVHVCDVAVFFVETRETLVFTVNYDAELALGLREIAERFVTDYVLTGKEPPPEASERFRETLTTLHPVERERKAYSHAGDALEEAALALREVEAMEKALKTRGELLRNLFRQVIGDDAGVLGRFGTITWTKNRDGQRVDYEALAAALRARLLEVGGPAEAESYARMLAEHTHAKEGARVLRKSWAKVLPPPALVVPELCGEEKRLALIAGVADAAIPELKRALEMAPVEQDEDT